MSPYATKSGIMRTLPIFVVAVRKQNKSAQQTLEMCLFNYFQLFNFDMI